MVFVLRRERRAIRAIYAIIAVAIPMVAAVAAMRGTDFISEVFSLRVSGPMRDMFFLIRGDMPAFVMPSVAPELAAFQVLATRFMAVWWGVGPGNGHFYVAPIIDHPLDAIASINSGVVRELLEWGVFGLAAFYALHLSVIRRALALRRLLPSGSELRWYLDIGMALVVTSLALDVGYSSEITGQLWLHLGILVALVRIARSHLVREAVPDYSSRRAS
jgi:hypothetical protein